MAYTLRLPRTFETGLLIVLVVFWLLDVVAEKTSLGKWWLGYRSELFPLSTFSVYLQPKASQVSVFGYEVQFKEAEVPVKLGAYDMYYPIQSPHLDDEIATRQTLAIRDSVRRHCAKERTTNFGYCDKHPAPEFHLSSDIGAMWLRSIQHHTGRPDIPESITLTQTVRFLDEQTLEAAPPVTSRVITFYPKRQWLAERSKVTETSSSDEGG